MESPSRPLLKSITLRGFLSFGAAPVEIPLTNLNVIIGPNGSGKSNLVDALSVLRAVPRDLPLPIREGGGVRDWLWNGEDEAKQASIEVVLAEGHVAKFQGEGIAVRYRLAFGANGDSFVVVDERIENAEPGPDGPKPYFYFGYENGRPMLNVDAGRRALRREDIDPTQSILSQRKDPDAYPELTRLSELLGQIRIYRSWQFGPDAALRMACRPDVRTDHLSEDFDNLPARLAVLKRTPATKRRLIELLRELGPSFEDLEIIPEGGTLQLYITESGRSFPARRLSDGTLRYLCLVAILLDPGPAPLVVIEEPELGLHPDVLPTLRDLMVEARTRSQLIVTTHSTQFVDGMTEYADSVLICEKTDGSSRLSRLSQGEVDRWRKHGDLGSLWMAGHFWGNQMVKHLTRKLFVEGGGNKNTSLKTECKRAFTKLLEAAGFEGRLPAIIPCGARHQAYDQFCTALQGLEEGDLAVLLVDSEAAVMESSPWAHVKQRDGDGWDKPDGATDDQLHLMVHCMEAWFLADREAMREFFGNGYRENALPSPNTPTEQVHKTNLDSKLEAATKDTKTRGAYHKGKHSFTLLAQLDPDCIRKASPWADRFFRTLDTLLVQAKA